MPRLNSRSRRPPTAQGMMLGTTCLLAALSLAAILMGTSLHPGHIAWLAFMVVTICWGWFLAKGALEDVEVDRIHQPRIFEGDPVGVVLRVRQRSGLTRNLVLVEDQFFASLSVSQRQLIPMMSAKWEAQLRYFKQAERHRGLYLIGPLSMWTSDLMGLFPRSREIDVVTRLTVYPRPVPLTGYKLLGPHPPNGPTMESAQRLGQGEEIISIRPYQHGDPPSRIHWRTSVRRRELHTIELDTNVQTEVAVFLDLTRHARFGTGTESTQEMSIGCATAVLSEAGMARNRVSLTMPRTEIEHFPPGVGLAHLHLMLDRLAVVSLDGDLNFWESISPYAARLGRGSRAIFIVTAAVTSIEVVGPLVRSLIAHAVAVDIILLNESNLVRIFKDQLPMVAEAEENFALLQLQLEEAGARVLPIEREETAAELMPAASEDVQAQLFAQPSR